MDICVVSTFWVLYTCYCRHLWTGFIWTLAGITGPKVILCLVYWGTNKLFSIVVAPFKFLPAMDEAGFLSVVERIINNSQGLGAPCMVERWELRSPPWQMLLVPYDALASTIMACNSPPPTAGTGTTCLRGSHHQQLAPPTHRTGQKGQRTNAPGSSTQRTTDARWWMKNW